MLSKSEFCKREEGAIFLFSEKLILKVFWKMFVGQEFEQYFIKQSKDSRLLFNVQLAHNIAINLKKKHIQK